MTCMLGAECTVCLNVSERSEPHTEASIRLSLRYDEHPWNEFNASTLAANRSVPGGTIPCWRLYAPCFSGLSKHMASGTMRARLG